MASKKEDVIKIIEQSKNEIEAFKTAFNVAIEAVLKNSSDVLAEFKDTDDFFDTIVDVVDQYTDTGLVDTIDGPLMRQALSILDKMVLKKKLGKDWFVEAKDRVKESLDNMK